MDVLQFPLPLLSTEEYVERLLTTPKPNEESVLAFYDHRVGGIGTNSRVMLLPLDDHLAHRGDGVFESMKYVDGRIYLFQEHLERMQRSAEAIYLVPPCSWDELAQCILEVAQAGKESSGMLRVLLGRGPGGFGISTAECPSCSLYIITCKFSPYSEAWYAQGLKGCKTTIPAKQGYLARIKNTNYLPNVLMIREANERGMDIPFCFSEDGFLAESAIANICIVNSVGTIEVPVFSNALPGTTVLRALSLLEGEIDYTSCTITEEDIMQAREVILFGTGPDCASIVSYEGHAIGTGAPGPVAARLRKLIQADMATTGTIIPGLV